MKRTGQLNLIALTAALTMGGCAVASTSSVNWEDADLHTVSVTMAEPNMKVDHYSHELVDSYYLAPKMVGDNVVMVPLGDILDELNGSYSFDGSTAEYGLNGQSVSMTDGSAQAMVNGDAVTAPVAAELVEGQLYVPFKFVFEQLGGKYTWSSKNGLAKVFVLRPKGAVFKPVTGKYSIHTIYQQKPSWYGSADSIKVADAMVANQNTDGGWFKLGSSYDLSQVYNRETFPTYRQKSTIDNDATYLQMTTLAKMYSKTGNNAYKNAVIKGVEYLVKGQYDNGGWAQFFPEPTGYHRHVTINDNALSNVLMVLMSVAQQKGDYQFIPDDVAMQAQQAVEKGMDFLLNSQVVVNGRKTGWCAQYNRDTLECDRGRSYELASISGDESVKVVRFLMSIQNPSDRVIDVVNSAVAFLDLETMKDKKVLQISDPTMSYGRERFLVDQKGSEVWPRFIDLETLKPLYSNRQGDHLERYDQVSYERRVNYNWVVTTPSELIHQDYPVWQSKYSPDYNVLN